MAVKHLSGNRATSLKSDIFSDSLGSSADGTNTGITLVPITYHASFDGTNDYVSIVDSSSNLIQGRSTWSISGWFKRNGSTDKYFISQWGNDESPDNRVFHIGIDSNGKLLFRQRTDGGQGASFTSNDAIPDKTWTHFAIVWKPNGSNWQAQMYINGTADNSKTDFSNDMRGGSIAEPVYLGKNGSNATAQSAGGEYFNGGLYQILFYSSELTSANVTTLYNSGTPITSPSATGLVAKYNLSSDTNDSQGSLNGTNNGSTFPTDAKLGTGAYSFDGSNDYVDLTGALNAMTTTGTIAFWVKADDADDGAKIWSVCSTGNTDGRIYLEQQSATVWTVACQDGGSAQWKVDSTGVTFQDGQWYHIAITHDGGSSYGAVKLYIDGVDRSSNSNNGSTWNKWISNIDGLNNMEFGRSNYNNAQNSYFGGIIDDVGIWNRVLTATEISDLVNSSLSSETLRIDQTAQDSGDDTMNSSGKVRAGLVITSASFGSVGKVVNKVGYELKKTGSPTGNVTVVVADSSGTVIETVGTLDISTLTTSYAWKYFENSSASHVLANGERIELRYSGGDGSNTLNYRWKDGDVTSHSNYATKTASGSYDNMTGRDPQIKIYDSTLTINGALVSSLSNKANLKAHYTMNTTPASASLDDDFSSYANQTSADAVWKSSDTAKVRVNISDKDIDFNSVEDDSNDSISYELGSTLSNTEWICRFRFNISTADNSGLAPGTDRHAVAIGMFDVDETVGFHSSTAKSAIYLDLHLDRDGTDRTYFARQNDATNSLDGAGQTGWSSFSTGTNYYCEIKRTSDANATMTIRTGSHTGDTALGTPRNLTTCAGIDNLKYFGIKCSQWGYGGQLTGIIDDVQVWDATTTSSDSKCPNDYSDASPITNLPAGSIMEATDDGKHYIWNATTSTWTEIA